MPVPVPVPDPVPSPSPPSYETVVVGTRAARTGGAVRILTARDLERMNRDDPHAVLQAVPGVYVRGEDGVGLRPNIGMRGTSPDRSKKVTLMEDGVLISPAAYSASAAYYFPLITRMVAVRVLKGPAAILYGPHTVGGAIDLITRSPPRHGQSTGLDLGAGDFGYRKLHGHFGARSGRTGYLVEGAQLASTGWRVLDGGGDTGFTRNEWMTKVEHELARDPAHPDLGHRLALKLGYSDEASDETYLGLTDADARATPSRRYLASRFDHMQWHRTALVATHRLATTSGRIELTTSLYRTDFDRRWRKVNGFRGADLRDILTHPDSARGQIFVANLTGQADAASAGETILIGPNQRRFVSQGLQSILRLTGCTGALAHALEVGTRIHQDQVRRTHTQDGFRMTGGVLAPDGRATETTADNLASTTALALHAIDAVRWRELTITPGARLELLRASYSGRLERAHAAAQRAVVIPGLGVYWQARPWLGLLGGVHRGFSPGAPGPTIAPPERSLAWEAGTRLTGRRSELELVGFWNEYQNLTSVCSLSAGCTQDQLDAQLDAGGARIYGLELRGEQRVRLRRGVSVPLEVTYTLTRTELLEYFTSDEWGEVSPGDELPYVPRHQLRASAGLDTRAVTLAAQATFVDRMRELPGQGPARPDGEPFTDRQLTVDASARWRPRPGLELALHVRNLLDARDIMARRPYGARVSPPRWVQLGLTLGW